MYDPLLDAAYRRTHYQVLAPAGALLLRIDAPCPEMVVVHRQCNVSCSTVISAWNPRSLAQTAEQNAAAHEKLCLRMVACQLTHWPSWGRDMSGAWPAEKGLFVLGLALAAARQLGAEFGQNALVHLAADCVPRLVWI